MGFTVLAAVGSLPATPIHPSGGILALGRPGVAPLPGDRPVPRAPASPPIVPQRDGTPAQMALGVERVTQLGSVRQRLKGRVHVAGIPEVGHARGCGSEGIESA